MNQIVTPASEMGESEGGQGPGRRLRKAREASGLIQAAIGQELRVSTHIIEAIERDDYSQLPTPVFVRGYLRSYARLVGLPPEPVIAAYDRRIGHEPPPLVVRSKVKTELRSTDRHVRWVTYLIVVALLALVALWWRNEADLRFWEVATHVPANGELVVPEPVIPSATPSAIPLEGEGDYAVLQPLPELSAPLADTNSDVGALPLPVTGTETDNTASETLAGDAAAAQTAGTAVADSATAASDTAAATTPAPASADASAESAALVLTFSATCWVDIRDADGQKLLYGTFVAGDRHALDGKAPFTLVLGNAPGVRIQFRGEHFDAGRYTAGNVARFSLGK